MTKVFIADDHPFIIAGVEAILRDSGFEIVGRATDGEGVLEALPTARPDILLLDVSMPGRSGVDVLRTLRSRGDQRPVVLLTASLEDRKLLDALTIGVQGIVLKDSAHTQLLDCLNSVRQGRRWIEPTLLQRAVDLTMNGGTAADPMAALTPRERAIVGLVAKGLRNREVADELGMTEGTVKVYLHRLYEKLGVSSRTELALLAKETGVS